MNGSAPLAGWPALRWQPDGEKFRLLAGILLVLFVGYEVTFVVLTVSRMASRPSGDFFALWSAARFVFAHPASQVYDRDALHAAQVALGMNPHSGYPFPYPPSFLLVLWPLGRLPLLAAYEVAIGGSLALYLWATVGREWRWALALGALAAPTTTITIAAGQAGFLFAALLIGGFRLAATRPILAGVLFGLATYKPQLGVLVPVALIAAGLWRTIAAACATAALLVVVTSAVFGAAVWSAWAAGIAQYSGQFAAESGAIAHLMPTVSASLARLGAAPWLADLGQLGAAAIAVWLVWRGFRGGPTPVATASLFVATFLATPHAFVYDMPVVATAVLWMIAERHRAGDSFGTGEILIMMLAMLAPIVPVAGSSDFPIVPLSLALLLAMIARRNRHLPAPLGVPGGAA